VGIEGRHFRSPSSNLTLGFSFAWHVFDDRLNTTSVLESGAVTGTQRRYANSLPFLLTADYYLNRNNAIKPFIGVGAGAYYIVERLDIGVFSREKSNWHFGLEGELGLQFPLGEIEGIVAARYHYAFAAGDAIYGDPKDLSYVTAVIGLAYTRW
jgi:outer membrane protein W